MATCADHPKIESLAKFIAEHELVLASGLQMTLSCGKPISHIREVTRTQLEDLRLDFAGGDGEQLKDALALIFTCFLQQATSNLQLLQLADQLQRRLVAAETPRPGHRR